MHAGSPFLEVRAQAASKRAALELELATSTAKARSKPGHVIVWKTKGTKEVRSFASDVCDALSEQLLTESNGQSTARAGLAAANPTIAPFSGQPSGKATKPGVHVQQAVQQQVFDDIHPLEASFTQEEDGGGEEGEGDAPEGLHSTGTLQPITVGKEAGKPAGNKRPAVQPDKPRQRAAFDLGDIDPLDASGVAVVADDGARCPACLHAQVAPLVHCGHMHAHSPACGHHAPPCTCYGCGCARHAAAAAAPCSACDHQHTAQRAQPIHPQHRSRAHPAPRPSQAPCWHCSHDRNAGGAEAHPTRMHSMQSSNSSGGPDLGPHWSALLRGAHSLATTLHVEAQAARARVTGAAEVGAGESQASSGLPPMPAPGAPVTAPFSYPSSLNGCIGAAGSGMASGGSLNPQAGSPGTILNSLAGSVHGWALTAGETAAHIRARVEGASILRRVPPLSPPRPAGAREVDDRDSVPALAQMSRLGMEVKGLLYDHRHHEQHRAGIAERVSAVRVRGAQQGEGLPTVGSARGGRMGGDSYISAPSMTGRGPMGSGSGSSHRVVHSQAGVADAKSMEHEEFSAQVIQRAEQELEALRATLRSIHQGGRPPSSAYSPGTRTVRQAQGQHELWGGAGDSMQRKNEGLGVFLQGPSLGMSAATHASPLPSYDSVRSPDADAAGAGVAFGFPMSSLSMGRRQEVGGYPGLSLPHAASLTASADSTGTFRQYLGTAMPTASSPPPSALQAEADGEPPALPATYDKAQDLAEQQGEERGTSTGGGTHSVSEGQGVSPPRSTQSPFALGYSPETAAAAGSSMDALSREDAQPRSGDTAGLAAPAVAPMSGSAAQQLDETTDSTTDTEYLRLFESRLADARARPSAGAVAPGTQAQGGPEDGTEQQDAVEMPEVKPVDSLDSSLADL